MDDVRGLFLGMQHGRTPDAVTTNKNIGMSSFKSSGDVQKKEGGPDRPNLSLDTDLLFHGQICIFMNIYENLKNKEKIP